MRLRPSVRRRPYENYSTDERTTMTEPIESVRHLEIAQTSLTLALETGTWTHKKRATITDIHRMIDDLIRNQKAPKLP